MRRMTGFLSLCSMVVAVTLSACDGADQLSAPDMSAQPAVRVSAVGSVRATVVSSASDVIGREGGFVRLTDAAGAPIATLTVPSGAVRKATLFTIEIDSNRQIHLLATQKRLNDAGRAGFRRPVVLTYSKAYVDAASILNARTTSVTLSTTFRATSSASGSTTEGSTVTVELQSFSGYGPTTD
jgi:hypothetical protein